VRTPGYLREATDSHHRFRNASIETYLPAVERIVARGGWVVRIGDPSTPPLPPMRGVVDYAHSPLRADWMDVFLLGAARFFLCTTSGPWVIAHNFGTPVAMANQFPFSERPFSGRDLFIPKLYRERGTDRLLGFAQAMNPPLRHQFWAATFERLGIDVVDNGAEEITELVEEMLARLDGRATYDAEDEALRARFDALATFEAYGVGARLGRAFLRRHRHLLP
jgi:putative glycosyltransferase (TIGR04372 family)